MSAIEEASPLVPELVYAAEIENPITRKPTGSGFSYLASTGKRIADKAEIARIASLAIPPAWTDVRIASNPAAHLQATGHDVRGRKQYRYHPQWSSERGLAKFALLPAFAKALPKIREKVDADLRRKQPDMQKALATVVWLLDNLFIRVGNEAYAQENKSYGLTTLRNRHVKFDGSAVRFRFKGKSGKEWDLSHRDKRIARAIRRLQELPGQMLFQYLDAEGRRHPVRSQDVNAYIREAAGDNFSSRQFRTWAATHMAAISLAATEPAGSESALKRQINQAIDDVAARLMNTRAVCRSSYIHPKVFDDFREGALADLRRIRIGRSKASDWMEADELRVSKWLGASAS
jgi:DNA topoisomerase-1